MGKVLTFLAVFTAGLLLMEPTPKVVAQAEPAVVVAPIKPAKPVEPDIVEKIASQAPAIDPMWVKSIYKVRIVTPGVGPVRSGSAVAVDPNVLHTAQHLIHQVPAGWIAEVEVNGQWVAATWNFVVDDLATLAVAKHDLQPALVRVPRYGERCTVYGLTTKSFAQGMFVGQDKVALEACEKEVVNGDSGGGIFGDDGALLGTLTGKLTEWPLITTMVPIKAKSVPSVSAKSPTIASTPVPSCPGGVCPRPVQYQPQQRRWFRR